MFNMRTLVGFVFFGAFFGNVLTITTQLEETFNDVEFQQKLFDTKHSECLKKYLNHTILAEELTQALAEDTMPLFMKNNCPKWHLAVQCYDAFAEELKPHLNLLQKLALQSIKGVIKSTITFICENNGKRLLEFVNRDGLECLEQNQEKLRTCFTLDFGEEFLNTVNIEEGTFPQIWKPSTFSGDDCKSIINATECFLTTVRQSCSNHSHVFLNDLLIGLVQKTPCWGVLAGLDVVDWEHYLLAVLLPKHIPTKDRICANNLTALDVAHQGMVNASKCWNAIMDNSFLLEDAQAAYEHRTHVSFLKKYCPKVISLASCVGVYMDSFQQCVEGEDSETLEATKDVVQGIVDFLCHRDGERILLFLKEDGLDCLEKQQHNIRACVESAGVYELFQGTEGDLGSGDLNPMQIINNLWVPQNYRPEECRVIVALEVCVYKNMKKCKQRSPANVISSLIRAVARRSPCWKVQAAGGGASSMHVFSTSLVGVSLAILGFFTSRYD